MMTTLADIGLSAIRKITTSMSASKADSLIDYTQQVRVEPIALVDTDVLHHEALPNLMQSLHSQFTAYYLQGVAISSNVGNINVGRHLDRLSPNRNAGNEAIRGVNYLLATESYKHRLPTPEHVPALEAAADLLPSGMAEHLSDRVGSVKDGSTSASFGRDTLSSLSDSVNLSVGKVVSVEITDGPHRASVPVSIRLMSSTVASNSLVHILTADSGDLSTSLRERKWAWKAEQLHFIRDLVFLNDLIAERRRNLIADKDGLYSMMLKRRSGNNLATIATGNPSVATASNLVVMSDTTAKAVESKMGSSGGRLKNFADREKMFKNNSVMILAVLDKQWDQVTFYYRGIPESTEVSVRSLKNSGGSNGPDVSDILRAFQIGSNPTL